MFGSSLFGATSTLAAISAVLAGTGIFVVGWVVSVWLVCAVLVAVAAHHRGRFAPLWLFLAVLLTPVLAGLMLVLFPDRTELRQRRDARRGRGGWQLCPSCGEAVRREARRCRFCLSDLTRRGDATAVGVARVAATRPMAVRTPPARPVASEERVEPRLQ